MGEHVSRRSILQMGSVAGLGVLAACDGVEFPGFSTPDQATPSGAETPAAPAPTAPTDVKPPATTASGFGYEIVRTEDQWRAQLSTSEYGILRDGGTEPRHSSPLTTETANGTYACKGCGLPVYSSAQKTNLNIGWVFFRHSYENSTLTGIDNGAIEAHCRRCGSHLGHILYVESEILHCINGAALEFTPA